MKDSVCVNCPANCAQCSTSSLGSCTSCLPGYYLDTSTELCTACNQTNCLSCSSLGCLACMTGYHLSSSHTCQLDCVVPCSTCSDSNPTECLACVVGFKLNTQANTNCEADIDCNSNGTCSTCPLGYSMKLAQSFSTCEKCGSNCARCNPNAVDACFSCFEGLFLNGTLCSECPSTCAKCSSATVCFECASGFIPQQAAAQQTSSLSSTSGLSSTGGSPVTCIACTAPCASCVNAPTTCLSCNSGFQLSGNNCLNTSVVNVSVTFNPTNNNYDFFNNAYNTILAGMATAANVAQNAIIVKSIIYNSVIFNADITTSSG